LIFTKEFENNGKIVLHLDGGESWGLTPNTYAWANADGDTTIDDDGETLRVRVYQLYYQQTFLDDKLTVNFGRLQYASFFDNNEYANNEEGQFLTGAFLFSQASYELGNPGRHLGFRVNYSAVDFLDLSYGYFSKSTDSFGTGGFNVAQATIKPVEGGNYRFYYWGRNEGNSDFNENLDIEDISTGGYGAGLSFDQKIVDNFGLFVRFSYLDPSAYIRHLEYSFGAQIGGGLWSRENDKIGIAVGQVKGTDNKKYKEANPEYKDGAETQAEIYYSFAINDNLSLTPALQYFGNPKGGNAPTEDEVLVYGIRTQFNF
jgi:carbohydrate-selective porin OprB